MRTLEDIVPHRAPMLLIDRIVQNSKEELVAEVRIHEKTFGYEKNSVPAWFGIEYMAQAIAAYNGVNFGIPGRKPEIGFLVGVRAYQVSVEAFPLHSVVRVAVKPNFIIDNAGTFDCKIILDNKVIGSAVITTYKPDKNFIEKLKGDANEQR